MSDTPTSDFLATMVPRQTEAESAWHHGDLDARLNLWSTQDPVTLFGGGGACRSGRAELQQIFEEAVAKIVPPRSFGYELIAGGASGDLAYTVGYERVSFDPGTAEDYTMRVTFIYRREDGDWKIIHRHSDQLRT